ncbi:MAG: zinc metalloprotease HtpX [Spirochaetia bacterium]|nr:zinc metalloprotease HtpX [Spirochaetia bacterium]
MNYFKTFVLMALLTVGFVIVGDYVGGQNGMLVAFGLAVAMNFFSYWFSDKMVLAMYGAKEVKREDAKELYITVSNLATRANLPMPKVYIMNTPMANAFATGRNPEHAAVAVTTGILDILSPTELEAVLAHEMTHIKNRDILIGTIAATFAGAITMLARMAYFVGGSRDDEGGSNPLVMILMLILAPIAALLIQMAISRSREYAADNGAAQLTGRPQALISALENLTAGVKARPLASDTGSTATAHMFIVNPFKADFLTSLFSTHPTLQQRKENLLNFRMR